MKKKIQKRIVLALIIAFSSMVTFSQSNDSIMKSDFSKIKIKKNFIGIGVRALPKITYERSISNRFSIGLAVSDYYHTLVKHAIIGSDYGLKFEVLSRFYFSKDQKYTKTGFYSSIQLQSSFGPTVYTYTLNYDDRKGSSYLPNKNSIYYGLGGGIGYKKYLKSFYLDCNINLHYWKTKSKPQIITEELITTNNITETYVKTYTPKTKFSDINTYNISYIASFNLTFGYCF